MELAGSSLSVYSTLNYLWSPLVRVQLSRRYPLFYPLDGQGIPLSVLLLIKDVLIGVSCLAVLRQLVIYRYTKHIHQSISKLCIVVLLAASTFGILTYAFSSARLPNNNSGLFGVFFIEHVNYTSVIGHILSALRFLPQLSLNWFGSSTSGLSSKFVLVSFVNKVLYLLIRNFVPHSAEFYRIPFNTTPFSVLLLELFSIVGILYQAQLLYLNNKPHLPKGK